MSPRKYNLARCQDCGLHDELCACDEMATVRTTTRIFLVQHVRERSKPTNTGKLAHRMLLDSSMRHWPPQAAGFDDTGLADPETDYDLLFPREDAVTLTPELVAPTPGRKRCFVVLDGTWHQCSRMARRVPRVKDMRCVALPKGPPSIWTVRKQHDPQGLSTMEAVLRLLEMSEPEEVVAPLWRAFQIVTARMLFIKGRLRSPAVPEDWPPTPSAEKPKLPGP